MYLSFNVFGIFLVVGLALLTFPGPTRAQDAANPAEATCTMNDALTLATTVSKATQARLGDGRLAPEDMNGPYGQRISAANTAFAEGRMDDACTLYQALIDDYGLAE